MGWYKLVICSVFFIVSLTEVLFDLKFDARWHNALDFQTVLTTNCLGPWWINQPDGQQSRNIALSMDCVACLYCSLRKGREILSTDEGLVLDSPNCSPMQQKKECYPWMCMFKYWDCLALPCKIKQVQYRGSPWEV